MPETLRKGRQAGRRALAAGRGVSCNAALPHSRLDDVAPLGGAARRLLEVRLRQRRLSARGLHRVRRVGRTLADLAGREGPLSSDDVLVALALRADVFDRRAAAS